MNKHNSIWGVTSWADMVSETTSIFSFLPFVSPSCFCSLSNLYIWKDHPFHSNAQFNYLCDDFKDLRVKLWLNNSQRSSALAWCGNVGTLVFIQFSVLNCYLNYQSGCLKLMKCSALYVLDDPFFPCYF